jgi:hypothetical protein
MTKLWVQFKTNNAVKVSTDDCEDVNDFLKACKKEHSSTLGSFDVCQLSLSTTADGASLAPDDPVPAQNTAKTPLFIRAPDISPLSRQPTSLVQSLPALTDFWNAFQDCTTRIEKNKIIKLPDNVFILGQSNLGSSIFIRHCYPELLDLALTIIKATLTPHLIILGAPGIGKTYFGYLLLLYLARSGATVVYESALEVSLYLLSPDGVKEGTRQALLPYLRLSSTFYIVDGMEPFRAAAAKTILLTSLRKDIWHQFSKGPCTLRYMPVWSREEIFACRSELYPTLSEDLVDDLYSKWGGIARYVLKFATDEEQQARLNEALDVSNIDAVVQSFGGSGEKADASSRLIHRSVKDGFHSGTFQFASDYVVDEIYNRVAVINREHLISFLSATQGIGETGQLRGILFEKHAHTVLANGGTFTMRDLKTKQETTLLLPNDLTTFMYSSNDAVFQDAQNCYFRPVSKIFESVDSFIKPNLLFQMTSANDHPCKQTGLRDILNILGNPQEPKLCFVVPPDRFDSFKYQNYHGTDGKVLSERGVVANVKSVSQFVLTFALSQ